MSLAVFSSSMMPQKPGIQSHTPQRHHTKKPRIGRSRCSQRHEPLNRYGIQNCWWCCQSNKQQHILIRPIFWLQRHQHEIQQESQNKDSGESCFPSWLTWMWVVSVSLKRKWLTLRAKTGFTR